MRSSSACLLLIVVSVVGSVAGCGGEPLSAFRGGSLSFEVPSADAVDEIVLGTVNSPALSQRTSCPTAGDWRVSVDGQAAKLVERGSFGGANCIVPEWRSDAAELPDDVEVIFEDASERVSFLVPGWRSRTVTGPTTVAAGGTLTWQWNSDDVLGQGDRGVVGDLFPKVADADAIDGLVVDGSTLSLTVSADVAPGDYTWQADTTSPGDGGLTLERTSSSDDFGVILLRHVLLPVTVE